jgi:hypothetical protein
MKRRHTREELRELLGVVEEGPRPLRARRTPRRPALETDELFVVWSAARAEANLAYDDWCSAPGVDRYLVYRAAEDRADAAEAALARSRTIAVRAS